MAYDYVFSLSAFYDAFCGAFLNISYCVSYVFSLAIVDLSLLVCLMNQ